MGQQNGAAKPVPPCTVPRLARDSPCACNVPHARGTSSGDGLTGAVPCQTMTSGILFDFFNGRVFSTEYDLTPASDTRLN
jgi:hypothetical protein